MRYDTVSRYKPEPVDGLWRSEDMRLIELRMARDASSALLTNLGFQSLCEFCDLEEGIPLHQRILASECRRCNEALQLVRKLEQSADEAGIVLFGDSSLSQASGDMSLEMIESELSNYTELTSDTADEDLHGLQAQLVETVRQLAVLRTVLVGDGLLQSEENDSRLMAGLIDAQKVEPLRRVLYRATRGNAMLRVKHLKKSEWDRKSLMLLDTQDGKKVVGATDVYRPPLILFVFFSGKLLQERVYKLCQAMGLFIVPYPLQSLERVNKIKELELQQQDLQTALNRCDIIRRDALAHAAVSSIHWKHQLKHRLALYTELNKLHLESNIAIARIWVPLKDLDRFLDICREVEQQHQAPISVHQLSPNQSSLPPPTLFEQPPILQPFQAIIDSYGVPRYKEINPAVLSTIFFPYLFGVMFGDVGHGALLSLVSLGLVLFASISPNAKSLLSLGYLLLLMGFFATYMGLVYNDMFGISTEIFGTAFRWPPTDTQTGLITPTKVKPGAARFGIDGGWIYAVNKLDLTNSIKMKCAIIVGILHMDAGLILSFLNYRKRRDQSAMLFRFIPEFILLNATFGYMALLILLKWAMSWPDTSRAPSLLATMTDFFLAPGHVPLPLYPGQAFVQIVFLVLAGFQIPILLFVEPLARWFEYRREQRGWTKLRLNELWDSDPGSSRSDSFRHNDPSIDTIPSVPESLSEQIIPPVHTAQSLDGVQAESKKISMLGGLPYLSTATPPSGATSITPSLLSDNTIKPEFDPAEMGVHQLIHTIEYTLGCVSNTASYLRLWALSLAHAQLSEVAWDFAFVAPLSADGGSGLVFCMGAALWLAVTVGILIIMEGLSAFLHTVRLTWLEFGSKFFEADGHAFEPFTLPEASTI